MRNRETVARKTLTLDLSLRERAHSRGRRELSGRLYVGREPKIGPLRHEVR